MGGLDSGMHERAHGLEEAKKRGAIGREGGISLIHCSKHGGNDYSEVYMMSSIKRRAI